MASTTSFTSFTITQPFLGAPLQFQPALGSQELEDLIDAYVVGPASKQDKLSEVTIDFYNRATVDLNTGALVRRYSVILSPNLLGGSPTESPPSFPGSSATFGDSGYASTSMTPPNRARPARVSKKPKKETKKTAELRLPGFSIMTKDGVDVTSSAGRGTKTKEQREHAHLMRIMKACDDCKRKKIRCDPSHRRSSETPASATTTQSSSSGSPSRQPTCPRGSEPPSGGGSIEPSNSMNDFVLFPEDSSFCNPDMLPCEFDFQGCDLTDFNFDISGSEFNDLSSALDESFDFSSFEHAPDLPPDRIHDHAPFVTDPRASDLWVESQNMAFSKPHPTALNQDFELLDRSWSSSGSFQDIPSERIPASAGASQPWPDYSTDPSQLSQGSGSSISSGEDVSSNSSSSSPFPNGWSAANGGANMSPPPEAPSSQDKRMGRHNNMTLRDFALHDLVDFVTSPHASEYTIEGLDQPQSSLLISTPTGLGSAPHRPAELPTPGRNNNLPVSSLDSAFTVVARSLELSAPVNDYRTLRGELERLHSTWTALNARGTSSDELDLSSETTTLDAIASQLQVLASRVLPADSHTHQRQPRVDNQFRPVRHGLTEANAQLLSRSLCATVTSLQAWDHETPGPVMANTPILTAGRNRRLVVHVASTLLTVGDNFHSQDSLAFLDARTTALPSRATSTALPLHPTPTTLPRHASPLAVPLTAVLLPLLLCLATLAYLAVSPASSAACYAQWVRNVSLATAITAVPALITFVTGTAFSRLGLSSETRCAWNDSPSLAARLLCGFAGLRTDPKSVVGLKYNSSSPLGSVSRGLDGLLGGFGSRIL